MIRWWSLLLDSRLAACCWCIWTGMIVHLLYCILLEVVMARSTGSATVTPPGQTSDPQYNQLSFPGQYVQLPSHIICRWNAEPLFNTTNIEMGERTCRWTRVAIRSASFCHQITWTTMVYWCCYCLHQTSLPNNLPLNLPTGGDDLLVYTLYDHWPLSRSISSTRRLQHVIKTWVISFYSILLVIIPHDKVK